MRKRSECDTAALHGKENKYHEEGTDLPREDGGQVKRNIGQDSSSTKLNQKNAPLSLSRAGKSEGLRFFAGFRRSEENISYFYT